MPAAAARGPVTPSAVRKLPRVVALLSATELEVTPLLAGLPPAEPLGAGGVWRVRHGVVNDAPLATVVSGVGKVNAAAATLLVMELLQPTAILLVGIGGAYPGTELELGDVALAGSETHLDSGVGHGAAWQGMEELGFPLLTGQTPTYNTFDLNSPSLYRVATVLGLAPLPFGTAEAITADAASARLLRERHGVAVESMEGAAVAQVAAAYGVPVIEIRGVSNVVGERDKSRWRLQGAVEASCAAAQRALVGLHETSPVKKEGI